jgi:hypothetical protein
VTTIVNDLLSRWGRLAEHRRRWESSWLDIADYCDPMSSLAFEMGRNENATMQRGDYGASSQRGSRRRYDNTAVTAAIRLTAGIESLVTPQSEKWHALAARDVLSEKASQAEEVFFDKLRDYLFGIRYDARSGFVAANQSALGSAVRYGTGITMVEEAFGPKGGRIREMPMRYRGIPLAECYIATDDYGKPNTLFRRFRLPARTIVKIWPGKCHRTVEEAAKRPNDMDREFTIIHAVCPREEKGSKESGSDKREYASYYVDQDNRHMLSDSGFFEFPYNVFYWNHDGRSGYGESPLFSVLDDVRGLNYTVFNARRAMQKKIDPAYFVSDDGVMARPNLNPGKANVGRFDGNGRLMFQTVSPDVSLNELQAMIEAERGVVREGMYQNLFNILTQNPGMTATEALLRSNEKADLLGPSGTRLQSGLSHMVDVEINILARHGAFAPGEALEAPESLAEKEVDVRFTSPIDRLRKAQEALGANNLIQFAGALVQMGKQDALDRIDTDKLLEIVREAQGVSRAVFREDEAVSSEREQRGQLQQFQAAAGLAEQAGGAANELLPALAGMGGLQAVTQ